MTDAATPRSVLRLDAYPRSGKYDPAWVMDNRMGPNVLWLAEALTQVMDLPAGARLLDLGCGRALSSIFLAKEFDVQVWAVDLWIAASANWKRICEAGVEESVFPLHCEAHALPFAEGFFDAIVSFDAYQYFGTDDLYLPYLAPMLRPGGRIGIVVPGLMQEIEGDLPAHLIPYWEPDFWCFHTSAWWARHWERSGLVDVEQSDTVPEGWKQWLHWDEICLEHGRPTAHDPTNAVTRREAEMLRADAGAFLGFTRVVARRPLTPVPSPPAGGEGRPNNR